jgi:dienelactone hydrolase
MAYQDAQFGETELDIPIGHGTVLTASVDIPDRPRGVVLFAHGSGSSRLSPRNRFVAQVLRNAGLGTFLLDLLTPAEDAIDRRTAALRFDIELLATRLIGATEYIRQRSDLATMPVGYFGASTGAAAALVAAAALPAAITAVVSRGGRPDLAGDRLRAVRAPTLLIVGGADIDVIALNRQAMSELRVEDELVIVPRATHLFEEPGALEEVAQLACTWFLRWFAESKNELLES